MAGRSVWKASGDDLTGKGGLLPQRVVYSALQTGMVSIPRATGRCMYVVGIVGNNDSTTAPTLEVEGTRIPQQIIFPGAPCHRVISTLKALDKATHRGS